MMFGPHCVQFASILMPLMPYENENVQCELKKVCSVR